MTTSAWPNLRLHPSLWRPRSVIDWLFMLLAPAAAVGSAFGSLSVGGVTLYPFKVLAVILLAVVLTRHRRLPRTGVPVLVLAVALAAWALASAAWSPAGLGLAIHEGTIFVLLVGLLVVSLTAVGTNWFASFLFGWPLAVAATTAVTAWELAVGHHLQPVAALGQAARWPGPLSTFGNANNYGAFLVLAVAVCAIGLTMTPLFRGWSRVVLLAGAALAAALLPLTASRFAIIGLAAGFVTWAVLVSPSRRGQGAVLAMAAVALPLTFGALQANPQLGAKFASIADRPQTGSSTTNRANLVANGWDFFLSSHGVGVGAAGFEPLIQTGQFRHPLSNDAVNPHNLWIEMLSQYGLVGIVALTMMLGLAARAARPLQCRSWFGATYVAAFAVYALAVMSPSSYVNDPVGWTYFATFIAIGVWAGRSRGTVRP